MRTVFKRTLSLVLTLSMTVLPFSDISLAESRSSESTSKIKTVEVFTVDKLSDLKNEKGFYDIEGTSKVNSITEVIADIRGFPVETNISVVEDVFDNNGTYVYSKVTTETAKNDFSKGKVKYRKSSKRIDNESPLSEFTETKIGEITKLTQAQETIVENNILEKTKSLEQGQESESIGLTDIQFLKLRELAQNALKNEQTSSQMISPLALEQQGAYDNYYNHDTSTGSFIAQALYTGSSGHGYYEKLVGTTYGSTKNATTMASFKSNINNYETNIINFMDAATWPEVTGYASVIASFVLIVIGFATGPAGWVSIVLNYASALATFIGLTSTAYGTYSRMSYSKTAQQYLENARQYTLNYPTYFDSSTTFSVVSGF
ncbi:hypothetical protein K0T92_13965 [Paenibacillus oenotherae]|uniref:Uncharacterized protein n=1 Tax=Paenibacillus oenotherae TaxID=1435645 RepID=A0ABS7D7C4_9BACL|nr:hypothetical protein [Paenibacillus oenotherae]MBW7475848.1 hypothetical protein [Paenibacillus oenotherae]